jgi:hypothetical protein
VTRAKPMLDAIVAWIVARVPAPMAAPETPALRGARMRILGSLAVLGLITLIWSAIPAGGQRVAAALVAGLVVFLAIQVPVWALAKWKADEAVLFEGRDDA